MQAIDATGLARSAVRSASTAAAWVSPIGVRDRRLPPIEERMDDLRAVLDAAGGERALLVAGADGGPLALPVRGDAIPSGRSGSC